MAMSRPAPALDPHRFGRRPAARAEARALPPSGLDNDLRLFAMTFAGGFLFVSILIG